MTEINELCCDIQMKLPDEIWMLDSLERYRRGAVHTDDFARMDGRTYLFGVVEVPLAYEDDASFTWGCWIEVDRSLPRRISRGFPESCRRPPDGRWEACQRHPGV